MRVWNIMIGEIMAKKTIQHINGTNTDSKNTAEAKQRELVDVKWEATPTWNMIEFHRNSPLKNEYKFFGENEKEDSGE